MIFLALPGRSLSDVQRSFLVMQQLAIGSPIQWTCWLLAGFCAYFWLRGLKAAEWTTYGTLLLLACSRVESISPDQLARPSVGVGLGLAALLLFRSFVRANKCSLRFMLACQVACISLSSMPDSTVSSQSAAIAGFVGSWFLGGFLFNDTFAKWIRDISHIVAKVTAILLITSEFQPGLQSSLATTTMLVAIAFALAAYWWRDRTIDRLRHVLTSTGIAVFHVAIVSYQQVVSQLQLAGRRWLALGIVFLIVGVVVSLSKSRGNRPFTERVSVDVLNRRLTAWLAA